MLQTPSRASTASSSSFQPLSRQNTMSSYDGSRSARQSKRYSMSALYMSMSANDSDLVIEDDLAKAQKILRELKSKISSQSKKNFVLEKDVRYLDSRIALLIQNRMALEEVRQLNPCMIEYLLRLTRAVAKRSSEPPGRCVRDAGRRVSQRRQNPEVRKPPVLAPVRTSAYRPSMPSRFHGRDRLPAADCHVHYLRKSVREPRGASPPHYVSGTSLGWPGMAPSETGCS